ncbi:MAG: hypothetical protein WC273_02975 [Dehalococcoidia bacterium]
MSRTATETEQPQEQAAKPAAKGCVHHWRIESPNGRESQGVCKRCGAVRAFANSNESVMWEQTNTLRNDANRAPMRTSKVAEVGLADEF